MTTRQHYVRLIEGFCRYCSLDEPERILQGGPISVDDIVFSLVHSEQVDAQLLFIYADYGEVPRGSETQVYRALLEVNLPLYTGRGPTLALSEESGRVVRADHERVSGTDAAKLHGKLQKIAADAKAWRDDPTFLTLRGRGREGPVIGASAAILHRRTRVRS